jgi:hypothetical protein
MKAEPLGSYKVKPGKIWVRLQLALPVNINAALKQLSGSH